jgi:hypothetical protein
MLAAIESRTKNPIDEEDIYLLATSAAYELQQLYTGFEKIVERHFEFTGVKACRATAVLTLDFKEINPKCTLS